MLQKERNLMMTCQPHLTQYVIRSKFKRSGALSYIGHLDLMRVFERAIRRAEFPVLYSQGYNPRPMLVFALPLGVGIDTEGDYVDIAMDRPIDEKEFIIKVNEELPHGVEIIETLSIVEPKVSLMSLVSAATYRLKAKGIASYLEKLKHLDEIKVMKKSKKKMIEVDIKPLIYDVKILDDDTANILVAAGSVKNLRVDVLLGALVLHLGYDKEESENLKAVRTELFFGDYPELKRIIG